MAASHKPPRKDQIADPKIDPLPILLQSVIPTIVSCLCSMSQPRISIHLMDFQIYLVPESTRVFLLLFSTCMAYKAPEMRLIRISSGYSSSVFPRCQTGPELWFDGH